MKLTRRRPQEAVPRVLSCDDARRLVTFVDLLMVVDRRTKTARKQQSATKSKYEKKGSHIAGPFLLLRLLQQIPRLYYIELSL